MRSWSISKVTLLTLDTHIHGAWESFIPISWSQSKSNILLALVDQSPVQSIETHITTMQRSDIVLIQRCMILGTINCKSTIGNTIGVTTDNTYMYRLSGMTLCLQIGIYLPKIQASQLEDCIVWSIAWINFLLVAFLENTRNTYIIPTKYNVSWNTILVIDPQILHGTNVRYYFYIIVLAGLISSYSDGGTIFNKRSFDALGLDGMFFVRLTSMDMSHQQSSCKY